MQVQVLVDTLTRVRPIRASFNAGLCLLGSFHADSNARLDLEVHHGFVSLLEPITQILAIQRLLLLSQVLNLLLLEDALQDAIARDLVHVQDFVRYYSTDSFLGQMVEHAPVRIFVLKFILQSLCWVL